ncbi:MAG: hypothetical protein P1U56_21995, partial [Saprospiraceae bacterium]|nr:hypothetical protein [Saprospiraceae bacterium]
ELTEEEQLKKSNAKAKRKEDRLQLTQAGVGELKLWLKDLIRIGLLELPNRNAAYFDTVIERMVDSKANGLAGWVRALKNLNFKAQNTWQNQALEIISKLFLLIRAAENLDHYSISEKLAIKSMLGWTFTQKELASDKNTISLKDHWLVMGSTIDIQDDLTIFRYWLQGLQSGQDALILEFENKFSNQANTTPILEGSVIEAELGFYPGLIPHRAFIKKQKEVHQSLNQLPPQSESWAVYQDKNLEALKQDPWTNNRAGFIKKVKILSSNQSLIAMDTNQNYKEISEELDEDKKSTLLLFSNNQYVSMAFVDRQQSILPLGLLQDQNYSVL